MLKSRRVWIVAALLCLGTIAMYWPTTGFDFVNYDDPDYVWFNPNVQKGLQPETLTWALTYAYAGNWHPVTWMSHMLDCTLFGLNPGAHHLVSVVIHALNTVLLFLLLLKLASTLETPNTRHQAPENSQTSNPKLQSSNCSDRASENSQLSTLNSQPLFWPSAIIATLFAVHPLHVESVAWISERKDVLSAFFFLLTIWSYVKYVSSVRCQGQDKLEIRNPKSEIRNHKSQERSVVRGPWSVVSGRAGTWYWLSLSLFALALMSKPMVVTLPFVLLLLDFWPMGRVSSLECQGAKRLRTTGCGVRTLLNEKIPFFAVAAFDCWLTLKAQAGGHAVVGFAALPLGERVLNAFESYWFYISKFFVPRNLAPFYPYTTPHLVAAIAGGIFILAVCAIAVWQLRARPYLFVGWFWFLGTLIPVIGLVQVGIQKYADRYMYIPMTGLLVACVGGGWEICRKLRRVSLPLRIGVIAAVACLTFAAHAQLRYWKNGVTLFTRALQVTGPNTLSEFSLAQALEHYGRTEEAEAHYRRAIGVTTVRLEREQTWQLRSRLSLASILIGQRKWSEAEDQLKVVVRDRPNEWWQAQFYLGETLAALGQYQEAESCYRHALQLEERSPDVWRELGLVLAREGKGSEALGALDMAMQLRSDGAEEMCALVWVLATDPNPSVRDGQKALSLAQRACDITQMKNAQCLAALDAAFAETGDFDRAIATAEQARSIAVQAGMSDLAVEAEGRIALYRSRKPYRMVLKQGT